MTNSALLVHLSNFKGIDDVLLLLADRRTLSWLVSQFTESCKTRAHSFIIGGSIAIRSIDHVKIEVEVNDRVTSSSLIRGSESTFYWSLPLPSAEHYRSFLDEMLAKDGACHQYLESDNSDAPVVVISLREY
jgi:hypothetical protein